MRKMSLLTFLGLGVACNGYYSYGENGALWDTTVAAANDGIYINLAILMGKMELCGTLQ